MQRASVSFRSYAIAFKRIGQAAKGGEGGLAALPHISKVKRGLCEAWDVCAAASVHVCSQDVVQLC